MTVDIPLIDWRHYLEDDLDMHNSQQSFAARQRMLNHDGDASQPGDLVHRRPTDRGASTRPRWPSASSTSGWPTSTPTRGATVAENRPQAAVDSCFDTAGALLAAGADVWDGVLDDGPDGVCTARFPTYSSSRRVAGAPYEGGVWKCQLQSVRQGIDAGLYGDWQPTRAEVRRLREVFPDGVCDHTRPGVGAR